MSRWNMCFRKAAGEHCRSADNRLRGAGRVAGVRILTALLVLAAGSSEVRGKVDLVTLPDRDSVQLTIYNSADLTLVREIRNLTVKSGINRLQFSWAGTLIDPTSLKMRPLTDADKIETTFISYPPRVKNTGVWNIDSKISGKVGVEVTYLTSGLSWRAFYMGTLSPDEKTMRLCGYVRVSNNSGEEYEEARTRLIVGKVHILDEIAALARREYPYDRPGGETAGERLGELEEITLQYSFFDSDSAPEGPRDWKKKEIRKEGLSEYFLYTIEGTETIADKWAKRLPSFDVADIPVVSLYKYDEQRWGGATVRFVSFANDEAHRLGETPIPNGNVKIYRGTQDGHLSFVGSTNTKYIPVDEEIELQLGGTGEVEVKPVLMDYATDNYQFDDDGNVSGWDTVSTWKMTVTNTRGLPIKVEVYRNFGTGYWDIRNSGQYGDYVKEDMDTARYELELGGRSKKEFQYVLRTYHGTRQEAWRE